jgi:hypothetical protein
LLKPDLKNFFGGLNHDWVVRFVAHRVGDPRLSEEGTTKFGLIPLGQRFAESSEGSAVWVDRQYADPGGYVTDKPDVVLDKNSGMDR